MHFVELLALSLFSEAQQLSSTQHVHITPVTWTLGGAFVTVLILFLLVTICTLKTKLKQTAPALQDRNQYANNLAGHYADQVQRSLYGQPVELAHTANFMRYLEPPPQYPGTDGIGKESPKQRDFEETPVESFNPEFQFSDNISSEM